MGRWTIHGWNPCPHIRAFAAFVAFLPPTPKLWFEFAISTNHFPRFPGSPNGPKQCTACGNNHVAITTAILNWTCHRKSNDPMTPKFVACGNFSPGNRGERFAKPVRRENFPIAPHRRPRRTTTLKCFIVAPSPPTITTETEIVTHVENSIAQNGWFDKPVAPKRCTRFIPAMCPHIPKLHTQKMIHEHCFFFFCKTNILQQHIAKFAGCWPQRPGPTKKTCSPLRGSASPWTIPSVRAPKSTKKTSTPQMPERNAICNLQLHAVMVVDVAGPRRVWSFSELTVLRNNCTHHGQTVVRSIVWRKCYGNSRLQKPNVRQRQQITNSVGLTNTNCNAERFTVNLRRRHIRVFAAIVVVAPQTPNSSSPEEQILQTISQEIPDHQTARSNELRAATTILQIQRQPCAKTTWKIHKINDTEFVAHDPPSTK